MSADEYKFAWHPYPEEKPKKCGDYLVTVVQIMEKTMDPDLIKFELDQGHSLEWIRGFWEFPYLERAYYYDPGDDEENDDPNAEAHFCWLTKELKEISDTWKVTAWAEEPPVYYHIKEVAK